MNKKFLFFAVFITFAMCAEATKPNIFRPRKKKTEVPATPALAVSPRPTNTRGPRAYTEVITRKAQSTKSFVDVHKVENSYFFEIPDSMFGREILVVSRIAKSAAGSRKGFAGYAGDQIGRQVISFYNAGNDRVFIRSHSYAERASDSTGMYLSVRNSNIQPFVQAFDVKAYKVDTLSKKRTVVIDVTDFIQSDNNILHFSQASKKALSIGSQINDRSYIDTLKVFPTNIEIRTVKTYPQVSSGNTPPGEMPFTFELNSSLLLLPEKPMKPRYYDPRVGYFTVSYTDFDKNPQGVERVSMITRWRMEPKDEDVEKYLAGELVEPKKPIVFYIDPTTPKKWVPYLIQGVNDWQVAFEQAGFKNAIYALEAPNDPTWSLEDARHSAIVYKPSDVPNASGPHVNDPRSGEILESHINWYHNVMKLLHSWYFVQVSAIDERARSMQFPDELMGELIRFVSAHEVGHTLGLRHNFRASSTIPVEKLRDREWLRNNHHTPSMMDYARFNYVAQPEDSIKGFGIIPGVGIYDKWSVEWGYRYMPQFETAADEKTYLNNWIMAKLKEDVRYEFGTETDPNDPRNQNEDLGDNAMKASEYGIRNMKRVVPNLLEWTREPNSDFSNARNMYNEIVGQYGRYMGHVTRNIGGIYTTPKYVEQQGDVHEHVPAATQREAMAFLAKQLFETPTWLINRDLIMRASINPQASIGNVQRNVLQRIISKGTIDRLLHNEIMNAAKAYTVTQMFDELRRAVWSEFSAGRQVDIYRRNLQKMYVDELIKIVAASEPVGLGITIRVGNPLPSDAVAIARLQLFELRRLLQSGAQNAHALTRAHAMDMIAQINQALEGKK